MWRTSAGPLRAGHKHTHARCAAPHPIGIGGLAILCTRSCRPRASAQLGTRRRPGGVTLCRTQRWGRFGCATLRWCGSAGLRAPSSRPLRPPRAPPPSADAPSQPCAPHRTHTGARTRCARHTRSSGECEEHGAMRWPPPKNSTVVTILHSCLYAVLPRARGGRAAVAARRAAKPGRAAAQPPQPQSGRAPARRRGRTFLRGVPAAAARPSGDCEGHGNMRW